MIKADDLREFRPVVRYQNGEGITLSTVQDAIQDCADKLGIPVAFRGDQVKSGGLFNSSVEDCVVLYHPEHQWDYYNICLRVKHQGNFAFVSINDFGKSKLEGNAGSRDFLKETIRHGSGAAKVGALIGAGARRLVMGGANKQKLEEEQNYYACLMDIFDEIVS